MGDCRSPAGTRSKFSQSGGTRREQVLAVSKNNHYLAPHARPSHLGRSQRGKGSSQSQKLAIWGLNQLCKADQGRPESTLQGSLRLSSHKTNPSQPAISSVDSAKYTGIRVWNQFSQTPLLVSLQFLELRPPQLVSNTKSSELSITDFISTKETGLGLLENKL